MRKRFIIEPPTYYLHRQRLLKFAPLYNNPLPYASTFQIPTYIRMKCECKQNNSTITFSLSGESVTYRFNDGDTFIWQRVDAKTTIQSTGKINLFVDDGRRTSTWKLIQGSSSPTPPTDYGFGMQTWGTSAYGG